MPETEILDAATFAALQDRWNALLGSSLGQLESGDVIQIGETVVAVQVAP